MKSTIQAPRRPAASNDAILPDLGANQNPVGRVCAANEARFTSAHFSEPLTTFAVGWRDPENLDAILQRIFPEVPVSRRFEFKKATNAEAFLSEADDIRAIGGAFKRVEYSGESVTEKTLNKGLTVRVDHDDVSGDDWQELTVARLLQRLARNDLRRGVALLDASATNANKVWSANNPDADVREMLSLGADACGIRPNVVAYGETAWDARLDVYESVNTPAAGRKAGMSPEDLARYLMVDLVEIVKARYQSTASAKAAIIPTVVYAYLALQGASKDDPSHVKRFLSMTESGRYRVYLQQYEKFTDVSVEHYSNIVATSTTGLRKLTVSRK
ncbi:MAG TPA: hypothetical protein PLU30_23585 [Verrucomicrobiae bacterium]|nr:hypothetical protein [Verrucomicrobiae bacterium]